MDQVLYDLMDWAAIEELVYSESSDPHKILGPHLTEKGIVIMAYIPMAREIRVKVGKKEFLMDMEDEAGVFAVLIPGKKVPEYTYLVTYDNGKTQELEDPYRFAPQISETELKKFDSGICYDIYEKMGAHQMEIDGVKGVYFAVWAPCAMRVSVVGDFNLWDGRRHPMRRLSGHGVFELFIPGLSEGTIYKYEVKTQKGEPMMKADPYGSYVELRPNNASIVWDVNKHIWQDAAWMKKRAEEKGKSKPMSVYEVHLGSWIRKEPVLDENGKEIVGSEFYNYREIAPRLADYAKEMGFTHVELMPVMEHPLDASWGYQVTGYYAPTSRYGTPDDFQYFVDYLHGKGIGVILDWVPAHFPKDLVGLAVFDGTHVYEHADPRQGEHPHWGTLIYNYGRPQVSNFLIANALYWADKFHADGIRMDAVASMLYLDYGKNDGEWVANLYGEHENLEAVEFLKHLNSIFKKREDGAVLIAEESTAWPQVTGDVRDGSLGFDYKWNMGWMNDFLSYMQCDPYFRSGSYGKLTFGMLYAYSENFILVFSHDEVVHGKASMAGKMPGADLETKFANLRAAYGFFMTHPGKKLLFMGQEIGQLTEWNENESIPWQVLEYPRHKQTQDYVKALNALYQKYPALYKLDHVPEGFEWVNCMSSEDNMVSYVRKTEKTDETLLVICNFAPVPHEKFRIGVPFAGKYKEILCSDAAAYGGSGMTNPRVKASKKLEWDGRKDSIEIKVAPLGVHIFSCTPVEEKAAKPAKTKKPVKAETSAKTKKTVKTEEPVKAEKIVKPEKSGKAEKIVKTEKPAKTEKAVKTEESAKVKKAVKKK